MTTASANGRLIRWAMRLDFTVKYRKGSSNAKADALSRIFAQAPLEQRYASSGEKIQTLSTMVIDDEDDFEVDQAVKKDVMARSSNHCKIITPPENSGTYKVDGEGTFQIIAFSPSLVIIGTSALQDLQP